MTIEGKMGMNYNHRHEALKKAMRIVRMRQARGDYLFHQKAGYQARKEEDDIRYLLRTRARCACYMCKANKREVLGPTLDEKLNTIEEEMRAWDEPVD